MEWPPEEAGERVRDMQVEPYYWRWPRSTAPPLTRNSFCSPHRLAVPNPIELRVSIGGESHDSALFRTPLGTCEARSGDVRDRLRKTRPQVTLTVAARQEQSRLGRNSRGSAWRTATLESHVVHPGGGD